MSSKPVLIVTHRSGFEADHVIDALRVKQIPVFRFNTDCVGEQDSIDIGGLDGRRITLACDGRAIPLSAFGAAWFHQPQPDARGIDDVSRREVLRTDTLRAAYDWIFDCFDGPWLNPPRAVYSASNKIRQLALAQNAGLRVPQTLISSEPDSIREFARSLNGNAVVKNLATPWYVSSAGTVAAYTKPLTGFTLENPAAIRFAPLVYQERIHRSMDVRAVVVGEDVFAASIPATEQGVDDIRRVPLAEAAHEQIDLPDNVRSGLMRLVRSAGLGYVSSDFAVSEHGEWYFLDLNASGAFLWVEKIAGYSISQAIADYLAYSRN